MLSCAAGMLFAALGVGVAVASTAAFLTFSWAFLPLLLGGGLLFSTAVTAGGACCRAWSF